MQSLNETKANSNAIKEALLESQQIQEQLQKEYDVYKEISVFGSSLYFAVNQFARINVLYLISVSAYIRLFLRALLSAEVML